MSRYYHLITLSSSWPGTVWREWSKLSLTGGLSDQPSLQWDQEQQTLDIVILSQEVLEGGRVPRCQVWWRGDSSKCWYNREDIWSVCREAIRIISLRQRKLQTGYLGRNKNHSGKYFVPSRLRGDVVYLRWDVRCLPALIDTDIVGPENWYYRHSASTNSYLSLLLSWG